MSETSDPHQRLRAVLDEALTQEPSAREDYLDRACAGDPELRPEVTRLLAAHQETRSLLEPPTALLRPAVGDEGHFSSTGRFRVLRRLGAGGMGVVYEVHDRVRDEVVALKTLLRTSAADLYRLKRERDWHWWT
jgi:eukaryotic-like serine/threonine-protein kinase